MSDFPPQWTHIEPLIEGGQGHTFIVRRTDGSDDKQYVLKRLKNPKRKDYFDREIQVCMTLDHPNVLKVIECGETPKGKPFLITEYYLGGSLVKTGSFESPISGLRIFHQILLGVSHAHEHEPAVSHLDLKPENILWRNGVAVVADFGICFVEDGQVAITSDGPRGSIYYCAPELRNPKIPDNIALKAADVYSLGKIVYWLFTHEVYDGHEEDYADEPSRHLATLFPSNPEFSFIDELVAGSVRRKPADRFPDATEFLQRVGRIIERIEAGEHVLDLQIPQRCLYCAEGFYRPVHELTSDSRGRAPSSKFPNIHDRRKFRDSPGVNGGSIYEELGRDARSILGQITNVRSFIYLFLVCDYCGNVQHFRLDLTKDSHGEHWRP
jgi:serine/threonine protein kinase